MTPTPISPSLISRITDAARYVISGVTPATWFGPMQPMTPQAQQVSGRRFDYPVGYNINIGGRASEPISFEDLRALADNCDILRSVIETRKDQVEALDWTLRVKNLQSATPEQRARLAVLERFMLSPDGEHSFAGWMRQILEDMFVLDAVALYRRRDRTGKLAAMEVIDGATIRPLLDESGRAPKCPDPAYQQVLKGIPAVDYTREELIYLKHNPRSHKVYGYSHVEQVVVTVNILIRRALHQLEYYREGSQPDALVSLPKDWTEDQINAFQKYFDGQLAGNLSMRRRVRFMPGEFKYQETKAPPLKDAYDEYLARIICYVFSVSPEPFVGHINRSTAQSAQERAAAEGLAPLQRFIKDLLNRIITEDFASPDLEFVWQDSREQDPKDAANINIAYVNAGILTVQEIRAQLGLDKVGVGSAVQKYNPNHAPAGSSNGGQFTSGSSAGDAKEIQVAQANLLGTGLAEAMEVVTESGVAESLAPALAEASEGVVAEGAAQAATETVAEATKPSGGTSPPSSLPEEPGVWKLGVRPRKSAQRWQNQMDKRGWTKEEITDTIKNGERYPAPNKIIKENTATRYENPENGRFVVRDDKSGEIIQISGKTFEPNILP